MVLNQLRFNWDHIPIAYVNGILKGYRITYQPVSSIIDQYPIHRGRSSRDRHVISTETDSSITSYLISNLNKYTNYTIQVSAFTSVGEGPKSTPVKCTTFEDIPSPPSAIKAGVSSSDSIVVSWMPPYEPNGIIASYTIYRSIKTIHTATQLGPVPNANHTTITFTVPKNLRYFTSSNLSPDTVYKFWVTVSNSAGESSPSSVLTLSPSNSGIDYFLISLSSFGFYLFLFSQFLYLFSLSVSLLFSHFFYFSPSFLSLSLFTLHSFKSCLTSGREENSLPPYSDEIFEDFFF